MNTDPVSDMLARLRNAQLARHESVEIPLSKLKVKIAQILQQEGYINDFAVQQGEIVGIRRASRPGRRLYVAHKQIPSVLNGMGISIISTSRGVLTDRDARQQSIGGEVLCEVW
jgi:small subunit ribosomal protein S8